MTWVAAEWVQSKPRHLRQGRMPTSKRKGIPWKCSLPKDYIHHPTQSKHHPNPTTTPPQPLGWYIIIIIIKVFNQKKSLDDTCSPPKNIHPSVYNAGKKRAAFCSIISISKVCAWTALGSFPYLWDFGGVWVGFWWAFSGVNWELVGVWFFIGPFLGFWWVLMGLNGNRLVLVTTMFGGTDPFLGVWWGYVFFWWGFSGNQVGMLWASCGKSWGHQKTRQTTIGIPQGIAKNQIDTHINNPHQHP